jgi:SAM-dependent methyltransferase
MQPQDLSAVDERLSAADDPRSASRRSPWWGLHAARYVYADRVAGRGPLLDIACGTGYGLTLLAGREALVGVDLAPEAVAEAAGRFARAGTRAVCALADGTRLPFRSSSFATVTSFETLEHVHDRASFVRELARVLRADGLLVLSTPNANYTRPVDGVPTNPYHLHEYTPEELKAELSAHFASVRLLGQTMSPAFGTSPFIDDQRRLPRSWFVQARLLAWRVANKTPVAPRHLVTRALFRREFYPTEYDYEFTEATVEHAPVLVALCSSGELG